MDTLSSQDESLRDATLTLMIEPYAHASLMLLIVFITSWKNNKANPDWGGLRPCKHTTSELP